MKELIQVKRNKLMIGMWIMIFLLLALGAAGVGGWWYIKSGLQPPPAANRPVRVVIPAGADSAQISKILETNGIVRNHTIFGYYLRYLKQGDKFMAGEYDLLPGLTLNQVIDKLNKGDIIKQEGIHFIIPEGFSIQQIAERLGEQKLVSSEAFLQVMDSKGDLHTNWTESIPEQPVLKHRLEGYLFPETYEMKKDSTVQAIIERMLAEWDRKLNLLPTDWQEHMKELGMNFHQVLTIASLIEREVVLEEERPLVAGVIYNRLEKKMPLQIDATIQYLFDQPKERLFEKDLQIESPYNTYLHTGLPPGPISNVGLSSLKAALYPAVTQALFYVTKKDGSRGHLFAETFEEHKRNIAESKK